MKKKLNIDRLDVLAFLNGLVFYAPVALLVRTYAGVTMAQFFVLQAVLSLTVFLFEIPTGILTDRVSYRQLLAVCRGGGRRGICCLFLVRDTGCVCI